MKYAVAYGIRFTSYFALGKIFHNPGGLFHIALQYFIKYFFVTNPNLTRLIVERSKSVKGEMVWKI